MYGLLYCQHRHNQELEEESVVIQQEKLQLQQQALSLSQRLEAALSGKFGLRAIGFDSDTPIDKAQAFLQDVIKVCCLMSPVFPFCLHLHLQQLAHHNMPYVVSLLLPL